MSNKLRVVFFGTPDFVVPILHTLADHFELIGIVTTPPTLEGRKKILTPSPVQKAYLRLDLEKTTLYPDTLTEDTNKTLKALKPDLFVVAAYGKIIPQHILDIPTYGSINIHPSLLPTYRGPSPIQTTLLHGDHLTGVTIILMDDQVDHGPILAQWEQIIEPSDTFQTLHHTLFQQAATKLPQIITDFIAGNLRPTPQDHDKAVFCEKVAREDGMIELLTPPDPTTLDRMIRAYYPWPTVWGMLPQDFGGQAKKGTIIKLLPEKKVQLQGRNVTTLKDFLNGYPSLRVILEPLFKD